MAQTDSPDAPAPPTPPPPLLLTSFQPWLPHQRSNASDDLLLALQALATRWALADSGDRAPGLGPCILLRNLPVQIEASTAAVRRAIARYQPIAVVACGLAERRSHLTLERYGRLGNQVFATPFPVTTLCQDLPFTFPSDNAGTFVCNALYATLLADHHHPHPQSAPPSLFVHVPPLTATNREAILADFREILLRLMDQLHRKPSITH